MALLLLIEDNPAARQGIQVMLEALGHRVLCALDGVEGLALIREHPGLQLVLTDIMLPHLDGISLLGRLTREHPGLPVIAMTGRQDSRYLQTAGQLGAKGAIYKPFNLPTLQEALAGAGIPPGEPPETPPWEAGSRPRLEGAVPSVR